MPRGWKMKKLTINYISIFIVLALIACSPKTYTPLEAEVAETLVAMNLEATHIALEALKTPLQTMLPLMELAETAEVNERENLFGSFTLNRELTIAENLVYDTEQVRITVKSLNFDDSSNPELMFMVENNSDNELSLRAQDLQINGFMMEGIFDSSIPAQSQKTVALKVAYDEFEASGVETIQYFEFNLGIDESQTWSHSITSERMRVNTDADSSSALSLDREGILLLEREGIRLSLMRFESPNHYTGTRFFILAENNTDIDIQLSALDLTVNGYELESSYYTNLLSGMKSMRELSFVESQLDTHEIESIDTLTFFLRVSYKDSSEPLFTSDLIEMKFEQP
jgi:hypothetical protein